MIHLGVGAVLIDNKKRVCLVKEASGTRAGKWNIPAGHLEHGEAITAGAKREVKEETGYDVELIALLPIQNIPDNDTLCIFYLGKVTGGSPEERVKGDSTAVEWFSTQEIEQLAKKQELRNSETLHAAMLHQKDHLLPLDIIEEIHY